MPSIQQRIVRRRISKLILKAVVPVWVAVFGESLIAHPPAGPSSTLD